MAAELHPLAPHHLPGFIVGPGESDTLLTVMLVVLLAAVLLVGNLYFKLHALPERIAHRTNKVQFQVVAVLALLALFTHNNLFWIAALLLALVQLPDFSTPLTRIAAALERLQGGGTSATVSDAPAADATAPEAPSAADQHGAATAQAAHR
jgi:multisubunit Na+/H+ antiporter MnhF subunit